MEEKDFLEMWGEEINDSGPKVDELTLKELTEMCAKYKENKDKAAEYEKQRVAVNKENMDLQYKIIETLEHFGMPNFKGDFGSVSIRNNYSASYPKDPFKKAQFHDYLKSKNIFEDMVSINHNTFKSWLRKEIEAERENDPAFVPPGVDEPEIVKTISLRKA